MNTGRGFIKTMTVFTMVVFALGMAGRLPTIAAQAGPGSASPEGLSAGDWRQIQSLLQATLPAQQAYFKASNTEQDDLFGIAVVVSGNTVAVGAYGEDSSATGVNGNQADNSAINSGAVYVFTRSGLTWTQQAYVKASNTGANDNFGYSLALDGDTLVVGAPLEGNSGAVYVFTRSGTSWSQQTYLKASNIGTGDNFGTSVAISGDMLVIGADGEDSNACGVNGNQADNSAIDSGAAYVFARSGTTWTVQTYLKASNTGAGDHFGMSAGMDGSTILLGAPVEDSNASGVNGNQADNSAINSGAAYVFTWNGQSWTQQAYLKASNTDANDDFGSEVAVSENTVIVGASGEDSNASGVNGNQADNSAIDSGAAYVFTRSAGAWSQQAYLKASNTGEGDYFGWSTSVDGNSIVVGAIHEESSSKGVNGNQDDNSFFQAGAVYEFMQKNRSTFRSVGTADGHILESGENTSSGGSLNAASTTFSLGDDLLDRQYRAVLSFNTAALPDTGKVVKVTLKIRKMGLQGMNPFKKLGRLIADIRRPFFGVRSGLEVTDFQADAAIYDAATCSGIPIDGWYSVVFKSVAYPQINRFGTTQIRLRFFVDDNNNATADYMKFFSGNYVYPASRPLLIIDYYVP